MTNRKITKGTLLGIIGFLLPQCFFIYTGTSSGVTIWIFLSFIYTFGYYEFPFLFGTETDLGFDILNPNWWFNPSEIATTVNFLTDADFYIQAFATFLYGGNYGKSTLDISGILFVFAGIFVLVGILLGMKSTQLSGIVFIAVGLISLLAVFLGWQNAINHPWFGGFVDSNFLMIPLGNIILVLGGVLNIREK
ncbi:MAG: hypothetical protein ACFFFG_09230 [Candidatus Thorarchaeota archaeon]